MPNFKEEARIIRELIRDGNGPDPFSSAVRATRMPMLITDPRLPDNPIVFANAAFARLTGHDRAAILGRNCRFLQGPDTDRADVARLKAAIAERTTIELELLNYKANGDTFWNRLLVSPVFDDEGALTYFFASQLDVTNERERLSQLQRDRDALETEVVRRTNELQQTEQRLQFALAAGQLGLWNIDLASGRLVASDECKRICGRAPEDLLTLEGLRATIHPDDRAIHEQAIDRAITDRGLLDAEYRLVMATGEIRWVQIRGQASYRADGQPFLLTGTTQDITERRRLQEERELFARELGHRVKNTLATLQSVAAQTIRQAGSLGEARAKLDARIQALSGATDLLIHRNFAPVQMIDLVRRTLAAFGGHDERRFVIAGPDVALPESSVAAFGLALHELATNAAKYGSLSVDGGQVRVFWSLTGDKLDPAIELGWEEVGGPPVAPPTTKGFGSRLLERLLATDAKARVEWDFAPGGLIFRSVTSIAPR